MVVRLVNCVQGQVFGILRVIAFENSHIQAIRADYKFWGLDRFWKWMGFGGGLLTFQSILTLKIALEHFDLVQHPHKCFLRASVLLACVLALVVVPFLAVCP